jgi:hypothetical protein
MRRGQCFDSEPAFISERIRMRIRIQPFISMRIRIQGAELMLIHADLDPDFSQTLP